MSKKKMVVITNLWILILKISLLWNMFSWKSNCDTASQSNTKHLTHLSNNSHVSIVESKCALQNFRIPSKENGNATLWNPEDFYRKKKESRKKIPWSRGWYKRCTTAKARNFPFVQHPGRGWSCQRCQGWERYEMNEVVVTCSIWKNSFEKKPSNLPESTFSWEMFWQSNSSTILLVSVPLTNNWSQLAHPLAHASAWPHIKHPQWLQFRNGPQEKPTLGGVGHDLAWPQSSQIQHLEDEVSLQFASQCLNWQMCLQLRDLGNENYTSPRRIEGNMVWIEASNIKDFHLSQRSDLIS